MCVCIKWSKLWISMCFFFFLSFFLSENFFKNGYLILQIGKSNRRYVPFFRALHLKQQQKIHTHNVRVGFKLFAIYKHKQRWWWWWWWDSIETKKIKQGTWNFATVQCILAFKCDPNPVVTRLLLSSTYNLQFGCFISQQTVTEQQHDKKKTKIQLQNN